MGCYGISRHDSKEFFLFINDDVVKCTYKRERLMYSLYFIECERCWCRLDSITIESF